MRRHRTRLMLQVALSTITRLSRCRVRLDRSQTSWYCLACYAISRLSLQKPVCPTPITRYRQELATTLVACLVRGQAEDPQAAAIASLQQLIDLNVNTLSLDCNGQGEHCQGCQVAINIHAWKGSEQPQLAGNMWCLMCNDDSMQHICLINMNYVKDMRTLLEQMPILHYHGSPEQMAEHLVQVWPSTKDMGGNMPSLNVEEVLTAFKQDLLEAVVGDDPKWWARCLTAKEKKKKHVVKAVHEKFRDHKYIEFTARLDLPMTMKTKDACAPECAYSFPEGRVVATYGGVPRPKQNHPHACGKSWHGHTWTCRLGRGAQCGLCCE